MLDIILVNVFLVFHSSCVNFINSYINHKPPGIQTLYDLVLANTLALQAGLLWFVVLILDLAEILGPVHPWVAWSFCFMIDVVFFIHNFFMILTTSVRYFSIYHSTLLLTFEDQQFLKVAWSVTLVTSFILTISNPPSELSNTRKADKCLSYISNRTQKIGGISQESNRGLLGGRRKRYLYPTEPQL